MASPARFEDLAPVRTRAVVLNGGTDESATLALASVRRHTGLPTTLVNCSPTASSRAWFAAVAPGLGVEVVEAPLLPHGAALDRLFDHTTDERILLVDSDAELLDPDLVGRWEGWLDHSRFAAAGWTRGPSFAEPGGPSGRPGLGVLARRPWTPLLLVRVAAVRAARDAGRSWSVRFASNELRWSRRIEDRLSRRFVDHPDRDPSRWRKVALPATPLLRREHGGRRPAWVWYDTGADLLSWWEHERGWLFAGLHVRLRDGEVDHVGGATVELEAGRPERAQRAAASARARLDRAFGIDVTVAEDGAGDRAPADRRAQPSGTATP